MNVMIDVTAQDIKYGVRGCPRNCMVAQSLERVIRSDIAISVTPSYVHINGFAIDMPFPACQRIIEFDAGALISPFSFVLDIPVQYLRRKPLQLPPDTLYAQLTSDNPPTPLDFPIPDTITTKELTPELVPA